MPIQPLDLALKQRVVGNLASHQRLAHDDATLIRAAVAITLVTDDAGEAAFVITRRSDALRKHSGQWALPGGRLDPEETEIVAALRELDEEIGLRYESDRVLGLLDDYPTRSGFVITPVVVWGGAEAVLKPNPDEVAEAHRVALHELDAPEVPRIFDIPESDRPV
ncbi:MAG: CoA pyrophosphatase, partial [Polyangiales bacterium]